MFDGLDASGMTSVLQVRRGPARVDVEPPVVELERRRVAGGPVGERCHELVSVPGVADPCEE